MASKIFGTIYLGNCKFILLIISFFTSVLSFSILVYCFYEKSPQAKMKSCASFECLLSASALLNTQLLIF